MIQATTEAVRKGAKPRKHTIYDVWYWDKGHWHHHGEESSYRTATAAAKELDKPATRVVKTVLK